MAYQGNAAYDFGAYQDVLEVPVHSPLSIHEGGGMDVRSRVEAVASASALVRLVVALTVALFVLGGVRVALTAQTVSLLSQVSTAESTLAQARDDRTELQVERSALTSTDRIQRIATENYGMAYATEVDTISIDVDEPEASAEDAQTMDVEQADADQA